MTECWIDKLPGVGGSLFVNNYDDRKAKRIQIVKVVTSNKIENLLDLTVFPTHENNSIQVCGVQWNAGQDLNIQFEKNNKKYELRLVAVSDMCRKEEWDWVYQVILYVDGRIHKDFTHNYGRVYHREGIYKKNLI